LRCYYEEVVSEDHRTALRSAVLALAESDQRCGRVSYSPYTRKMEEGALTVSEDTQHNRHQRRQHHSSHGQRRPNGLKQDYIWKELASGTKEERLRVRLTISTATPEEGLPENFPSSTEPAYTLMMASCMPIVEALNGVLARWRIRPIFENDAEFRIRDRSWPTSLPRSRGSHMM
jgi:hypothetical protein